MATKIEKLTGKTLEEADFGPYQQYVKGAAVDRGTLKIHTEPMPNALYATLRDYLAGLGFKRHPRDRYFFVPATPETEAVAQKLAGGVVTIPPQPETAEEPATAGKPAPKPTKRQVTPIPKPTRRRKSTKRSDDAWVDDIPMA
ncbi:MAG: hypothetical protein JXA21_10470 [Anaerolineae bacterium]|nr:hypothetical protein [Anaerolineae bacterium]